jgi:hypothetical protein
MHTILKAKMSRKAGILLMSQSNRKPEHRICKDFQVVGYFLQC